MEVSVHALAFPEKRGLTADQVCLNSGEDRYPFKAVSLSQRLIVQTLILPSSPLLSTSNPRQPSQALICFLTLNCIKDIQKLPFSAGQQVHDNYAFYHY
jgi:hypothetical protein